METDAPDFVLSKASAERKASLLKQTTKTALATCAQQIELDKVLVEMAEIIASEDGILTP
jgi:hypothetical protein